MKIPSSNVVAKAMWRPKMPAMRSLALILALATTVSAQQPEGGNQPPVPPQQQLPPGPRPDGPPARDREHGRDHGRDGDRRGPPGGMMHGMGKPPMRYDGFEKLSETERTKVRAAFEKAWQRGEVIEARDHAMKANEDLRNTLHKALREIDPEVVGILEKVKNPFPVDQRSLPELPRPDSPEFGRMAVARVSAEMMSVARPERRDDTRRFNERLTQMPRIREAVANLEKLPPEEKMEGFKRFRDLYRQVATEEFMKLREMMGGSPKDEGGGFRRPPESGPPPPPPEPKLN